MKIYVTLTQEDRNSELKTAHSVICNNKVIDVKHLYNHKEGKHVFMAVFDGGSHKYLGYCFDNDTIQISFEPYGNSIVVELANKLFNIRKAVRIHGDYIGEVTLA